MVCKHRMAVHDAKIHHLLRGKIGFMQDQILLYDCGLPELTSCYEIDMTDRNLCSEKEIYVNLKASTQLISIKRFL